MKNSRKQPNVLVFFTDQQRHDSTGVHGNPLGLTPNFDALAARGTHLFHSFTCQPVCGPARAVLQSGLYPTTTGCFTNGRPLPPNTRTLAHYFREAGYTTGYIGKWHLAPRHEKGVGPVAPEHRGGYEYWLASNTLEHTSDAYDTVLYDDDCEPVKLPGYRVDALTDAAIRYIGERKDEPFFLFLSFIEPHHQNHRDDYPAPDGYAEKYAARWTPPDLEALGGSSARHLPGYWGMVKRLDEALGRVLDALKSLDLSDDTIVLFTSDHGNHFKTRNSEYKRSCHEASIRVPTAICGPGFEGGGRRRELVSLIDLPPTLLDAADVLVPDEMQGDSLMPLLNREISWWRDDIFVQISESHIGRAIRTERWKYAVRAPQETEDGKGGASLYVEDCLYDLQADPYELNNLLGKESHAPVTQVLRERLLRRMAEAGESAPQIEVAPAQPSGQFKVSEAECQQ
jgi:arylsulfatase A-like enzyme